MRRPTAFLIGIGPREVAGVLMVSIVAAVLVVVVMVVLGEYTKTGGRLFLTPLSLSGFCLLALAPVELARRPGTALLGRAGLAAAALGCVLLLTGLWATPNSDAYWKAAGVVSVGASCGSYLCLLWLGDPRRLPARAARRTAALACVLALALASAAIIAGIKAAPYWLAAAIIIMVQIAAGLAYPALNRPPRRDGGPASRRG